MQAYFDKHDADLELETLVTRSHSKADSSADNQNYGSARRRLAGVMTLSAAMSLAVVLLAAHLGSATPAKPEPIAQKSINETRFVIEIPPKVKPKPKPKPVVEPPKPKVIRRLRSVPDSRLNKTQPLIEPKKRKAATENKRSESGESTRKRAMPAVETPVVADRADALRRDEVTENLRYAYVENYADTIGGFVDVAGGTESRNLPDENVSHIKLDPYHYNMVSICLRLCVKSMFSYSGISQAERESSSRWLRIERGSDEHFTFLYDRNWLRFSVKTDQLGDISNLDFVQIPHGTMSDDEVNLLLEEVTRKLCKLLGYDDCFEQL
jgi:hypothetical protein